MIAFLEGIVRLIREKSIVLDVNGVGYEIYMSDAQTRKQGDELFVYTYEHVREDAILLYGFTKEEDYEVFMRLIDVKGIGPRSAQNILAVCPGRQLIEAIENDDIKRLKSLPGIGAKTAGQIVLDLKGKFVSVDAQEKKIDNPVWDETEEALLSLGYKSSQLGAIRKELAPRTDLSTPEMVQMALRQLAK
ncbi:Holliday junction branch migration protein RuvA [Catenisphaera adipataccumulans]|uniref:Holliday junction branch migration complex subunit RuvA n=2 Tax=Catenisphaera adipataccumulans TaxID=700500 RepID=A0A7W8FW92_9FIRM|nr:Holliday junction branch migration protein RuvA [Catenisphaera adipataccumulans]MBB5182455.1 Holliday junction DNA helicase RuvA [Catenisphaera adipataccumulans]